MKKSILLSITLLSLFFFSNAQTTVMQLSGADCNGNNHDLFADLDAGKAVLLHFYMPNCSACPPVAKKIEAMANNILAMHPGMITGYAMPFNNTTTCTYAASWVSTNALSIYMPFDSGATQVANYGGFGMPTVVLLGGTDHRVMFSTLSFSTADTTQMRDSIMALLEGAASAIHEVSTIASANVFPNPATDKAKIELSITAPTELKIEIVNQLGEVVSSIFEGKAETGIMQKEISTASLANGLYVVRVTSGRKSQNYKLNIAK